MGVSLEAEYHREADTTDNPDQSGSGFSRLNLMDFLRENQTEGSGSPEEAGIWVYPGDGRGRNVD